MVIETNIQNRVLTFFGTELSSYYTTLPNINRLTSHISVVLSYTKSKRMGWVWGGAVTGDHSPTLEHTRTQFSNADSLFFHAPIVCTAYPHSAPLCAGIQNVICAGKKKQKLNREEKKNTCLTLTWNEIVNLYLSRLPFHKMRAILKWSTRDGVFLISFM